MEEIELVVKGKVNDLRYSRDNAYVIYCSMVKNPAPKEAVLPLPFDDEIEEVMRKQKEQEVKRAEDLYKNAYFPDWNNLN